MNELKQLPDEIRKRIESDAVKCIPMPDYKPEAGDMEYYLAYEAIKSDVDHEREIYISGATAEASRSLILVEALEKIANGEYFPEYPTSAMISNAKSIEAMDALTSYNNPDKKQSDVK